MEKFHKTLNLSGDQIKNLKPCDRIILGEEPQTHYDMQWIEKDQNPFNRRIFDCREYAINRMSITQDENVIHSFNNYRKVKGIGGIDEGYLKDFFVLKTNLQFDLDVELDKHILFKASCMEEKWDIFKDDKYLFFIRSWTGGLVYVCKYRIESQSLIISEIKLNCTQQLFDPEDPLLHIKIVQFLIISHAFNQVYPHPLPLKMEDHPQNILELSFSLFGNRGYYATYD